ncbi:hypothetical protein OF83DRAFT_1089111 [Amylostereum chailletii]|nr:hypothetical protein OF83DRAFT_1089111 [Amylostereum chailletii]
MGWLPPHREPPKRGQGRMERARTGDIEDIDILNAIRPPSSTFLRQGLARSRPSRSVLRKAARVCVSDPEDSYTFIAEEMPRRQGGNGMHSPGKEEGEEVKRGREGSRIHKMEGWTWVAGAGQDPLCCEEYPQTHERLTKSAQHVKGAINSPGGQRTLSASALFWTVLDHQGLGWAGSSSFEASAKGHETATHPSSAIQWPRGGRGLAMGALTMCRHPHKTSELAKTWLLADATLTKTSGSGVYYTTLYLHVPQEYYQPLASPTPRQHPRSPLIYKVVQGRPPGRAAGHKAPLTPLVLLRINEVPSQGQQISWEEDMCTSDGDVAPSPTPTSASFPRVLLETHRVKVKNCGNANDIHNMQAQHAPAIDVVWGTPQIPSILPTSVLGEVWGDAIHSVVAVVCTRNTCILHFLANSSGNNVADFTSNPLYTFPPDLSREDQAAHGNQSHDMNMNLGEVLIGTQGCKFSPPVSLLIVEVAVEGASQLARDAQN